MFFAPGGLMERRRVEHPAPQRALLPLEERLPGTRTGGVTPDRADLDRDYAVEAPPPLVELPTDRALAGGRRTDEAPIEVPGLGPLPVDGPGLETRVARLVRGQGLSEVTQRLAEAGATAQSLRATLTRHGRSDAYPAELCRRLQVMEAMLPAFAAEQAAVQANLQPYVVEEAYAALDAGRARAEALERQYFDPTGYGRPEALRSLRADAQALLQARGTVTASRGASQAEAEAAYRELHREISGRHPLLACFDLATPELAKLQDLAMENEPDEYEVRPRRLDVPLREMLHGLRTAISDLRAELRDHPEVVWRLPAAVDATLIRQGIPARGMVAAHAHDLVRSQLKDDAVVRGFVSILSVALGIATALPTGGTSVAMGAAAASAVDGYQLYLSVQDYRLFQAASGTAVDRREALSDQVPSAGWLALEAIGMAAGAIGVIAGIRKSAFTRLLADEGPAGEMARGLEHRLGSTRAETLLDALGEGPAERLYRELAPETWHELAELAPTHYEAAVQALGADGLRALGEVAGAEHLGTWIAQVPEDAWRALAATPLNGPEVLRLAQRFPPEQIGQLAPQLKGRGLVELAEHLGDAQLTVAADHVLVDGQLRMNAHELLRVAKGGELASLRQRLATAQAMSPAFAELGPLNRAQLTELEGLAEQVKDGAPLPRQALKRLSQQGRSEARVLEVSRALAEQLIHLSPRSEALAKAAPELRAGLEALQTSGVGPAMTERTQRLLEAAISLKEVTIDRPHLGALLKRGAQPTINGGQTLESHLLELECALHAAESGEAARGSTVYLGVAAGERVQLALGGPWVELPKPAPGEAGVLQDADVLFLTPAGEVQLVEVKRSGQTLWENLEKSKGLYFDKFDRWRDQGASVRQERKVAVAIRHGDDGWLEKPLTRVDATPVGLLREREIELRQHPKR